MQFLFMLLIPITAFVCYTIIQKFIINKKPLEKGLVDQTTVELKPLFCKDCRYCIGKDKDTCSKVMKTFTPDGDYLVSGNVRTSGDVLYDKYWYCKTHRASLFDKTMCQAEAKFFEPKEEIKQ